MQNDRYNYPLILYKGIEILAQRLSIVKHHPNMRPPYYQPFSLVAEFGNSKIFTKKLVSIASMIAESRIFPNYLITLTHFWPMFLSYTP